MCMMVCRVRVFMVCCVRAVACQVAKDLNQALIHLQDQHLRTVALFKRLRQHGEHVEGGEHILDARAIGEFLQQLMTHGCLELQVGK